MPSALEQVGPNNSIKVSFSSSKLTDSLIIREITVASRANDSAKISKLWEKSVKEVAMSICWQEILKISGR